MNGRGLSSSGESNAVVLSVVDGVILPQEHISQNPQGLAVLGRQVGTHDAAGAVLLSVLVVLEEETKKNVRGENIRAMHSEFY